MDTFITSFVIYGALALALAAPITYVSWRKDRTSTMRNFFITASVIALCCAVLEVVSERQVQQCLDAAQPRCFDVGAAGLQFLFVGLYAAAAWFNAYFMWRD